MYLSDYQQLLQLQEILSLSGGLFTLVSLVFGAFLFLLGALCLESELAIYSNFDCSVIAATVTLLFVAEYFL